MTAILEVGFRPFYLLAAVFAVVALPVWMGFYFNALPAGAYLVGISWHTHEMLFAFAPAVIAGFLKVSTAVDRTKGAKKAMSDYGLKFNPQYFVEFVKTFYCNPVL